MEENKKQTIDEKETFKLCKLLQLSYDYNHLLSVIIGAGNTNSDYSRHHKLYNIALGGECSDDGDASGLYAFPYYVPSEQFNQIINIIGDRIGMIAIDWSVCCEFSIQQIVSLMKQLNKKIVMYIPYRNIKTVFNRYMDDVIKYKEKNAKEIELTLKHTQKSNIIMEFFNDNSDKKYPIKERDIHDNGIDIIYKISYAKFYFNDYIQT